MAVPPAPAAFVAIAKQLYGDVFDPRELWELTKNAPDTADVHNEGEEKKKPGSGHKKVGGLLLLGTAAETDAAVHAGQAAAKTVRSAANMGTKVGSVGRAGLQAANLGIGLIAARQLMKKPKPVPVAKAGGLHAVADGVKAVAAKVRPPVMTAEQAETATKALTQGSSTGTRVLLGTTALGTGIIGHHLGVKRGRNQTAPVPVAKAFRVKPINPANAPKVVSLKARRPAMAPPLAKSLSWTGEISKVDEDKHLVFGWCSLSSVDGQPVVDLQGDFVPLEEIEKSAYKYVIESRKGGDMHKRVSKLAGDQPLHTADMVESFVVTPEKLAGMGLAEDALPHGWWVGFKVNDETQWQMVKSGERAGFSIHGTGQRRAA